MYHWITNTRLELFSAKTSSTWSAEQDQNREHKYCFVNCRSKFPMNSQKQPLWNTMGPSPQCALTPSPLLFWQFIISSVCKRSFHISTSRRGENMYNTYENKYELYLNQDNRFKWLKSNTCTVRGGKKKVYLLIFQRSHQMFIWSELSLVGKVFWRYQCTAGLTSQEVHAAKESFWDKMCNQAHSSKGNSVMPCRYLQI